MKHDISNIEWEIEKEPSSMRCPHPHYLDITLTSIILPSFQVRGAGTVQ